MGVFIGACGKKPEAEGAATPTPSAAPSATSASDKPAESAEPVAAAPPKELKGCEKVLHDFDEALSAATFACSKDTDCKCYGAGLSKTPGSECGGIVEAQTAKKLDALTKDAKKDGCGTMAQCEPWSCEPICDNGRCQRGPREKSEKKSEKKKK